MSDSCGSTSASRFFRTEVGLVCFLLGFLVSGGHIGAMIARIGFRGIVPGIGWEYRGRDS